MVYKISRHLDDEFNCFFSTYYSSGILKLLAKAGLFEFSVLGKKFLLRNQQFFSKKELNVDHGGNARHYSLAVTTSDLIIPGNLKKTPIVLVQEGMTDPENLMYRLVKRFCFPRWLASTASMGLSDRYEIFCVASEGYRSHFMGKGVKSEKIRVTGIPNFDHLEHFRKNDFPFSGYVLVATSDTRETFKRDNRRLFLMRVQNIARGKQVIFKLHPNENRKRSVREILEIFPDALVFNEGPVEEMVANCDILITQYSSVVYMGLALNKECHSNFNMEELKKMTPIQNEGTSAENIAGICRELAIRSE